MCPGFTHSKSWLIFFLWHHHIDTILNILSFYLCCFLRKKYSKEKKQYFILNIIRALLLLRFTLICIMIWNSCIHLNHFISFCYLWNRPCMFRLCKTQFYYFWTEKPGFHNNMWRNGYKLSGFRGCWWKKKSRFLGASCFLWEKAILIKERKKFHRRKGSP